jgi:hypothetical protein
MVSRQLSIFLVRAARTRSSAASVANPPRPTSSAASPAVLTTFDWHTHIRKPPPSSAASKSATHDAPSAESSSFSRSDLWRLTKSAFTTSEPIERRRRLKSLSQTLVHEASSRGCAAVAEGQAWMDAGKPGSFPARLKSLVEWMLAQIDRREGVLKEIDGFMQDCVMAAETQKERQSDSSAVHSTDSSLAASSPRARVAFRHPAGVTSAEAASSARAFLAERITYHTRWQTVTILLLPVTSAAFIIPGPNIFLAWNAFRLYGHYTARRGALQLEECIRRSSMTETETSAPAGAVAVNVQPAADAEEETVRPADVVTVEFEVYQREELDALFPTVFKGQ